jgi:hypothetical protein
MARLSPPLNSESVCLDTLPTKYRIESTRLRGWDYGTRGWYFVTICSQHRACIFGEVVAGEMQLSPAGRIAESELRGLHLH